MALGNHDVRPISIHSSTNQILKSDQRSTKANSTKENPAKEGSTKEVNQAVEAPLSFSQRQLYFLGQITADGAEYNIPNAYSLRGLLQVEALQQSLQRLVVRHAALRTRFQATKERPVQIVEKHLQVNLQIQDFSHLPYKQSIQTAQKRAVAEANQPFDLALAPLWRVTLLRLTPNEHWLLFTVHHIIFDGWSVNIFFGELLTLYEAICKQQPCELPALPLQYTDFTRQQQQQLQGDFLAGLLKYWTQRLGGELQPLELPSDYPRPPQPSYRGASASIEIPARLVDKLRVLGQQKKATLFMTLLAAFKVLLFRYTNQTDIVVGTPIANRSRPEFRSMIGFLVNTLVLRNYLEGSQSFWQVLERVRTSALEAYDYQALPFDLLVEALQPERDLSYNPLFQVMFQLHEKPTASPADDATDELLWKPLEIESDRAMFDLVMEAEVLTDGLLVTLEYSQDLFEASTIERMLGHFQQLLEGIAAAAAQPIAQLPLLSPAERTQLIEHWSRTESRTESRAEKGQLRSYDRPYSKSHSRNLSAEELDLTLSLQNAAGKMVGELTYYGDLSRTDAIATALEKASAQLRQIAKNAPAKNAPYTPPYQLYLETENPNAAGTEAAGAEAAGTEEKNTAQLTPDWHKQLNPGDENTPTKCLHQHFVDQVEQTPHRIAVSYQADSYQADSYHTINNTDNIASHNGEQTQQLTYAQLNARANQLAHHLLDCGIQPDQPVGLFLERSPEIIVALLAVLKAGGAYLPIAPDYPQERISYIINDAKIDVILTQSHLSDRLSNAVKHTICVDRASERLATQSKSNPIISVTPRNLAYIIYTSGSTGKPKGVMIEHQAASHFVRAAIAQYGITKSDCVLQFAAISFDLAVEEIFISLLSGAKLQLRNETMLGTAAQFTRCCQDWGLTVLNLPTAYWHQLVADMATSYLRLPEAIRLVIIGGERALPSRVKTWQTLVGDYPLLINAYGPTEATVTATGFTVDSSTTIHQEVPIGRPFANVETYILDPYAQPVPIGITGELHIGGKSLARGYLHRQDLTQLKFIPHPFSSDASARLYKTGDQARYLPDGNIEFLGRIDTQVKIRGFRIELGEIESALLQFPGVRETVVTTREDGLGHSQLAAYIIEQPSSPVSITALKNFLRQTLPSYLVPSTIDSLTALPLTPNGKVDLQALPEPAVLDSWDEASLYIAPRTPIEETLSVIWAQALGRTKVSIRDSFFELGGHSLQAIQVMAQIVSELEVELPLSALFQAPTVEEMAQLLHQAGAKSPWTPLVALQSSGSKRPFFAVHGGHGEVLFYQTLAQHLGKDQPFYAMRALGNDYPDIAHTRIEDMASCYIEAMRRVQPEGPYRIGGTSLGGIVAFEMAQQLQAIGQTTERLVLFDTGGFENFAIPLPWYQRLVSLFRYIPKYGIAETWRRLQLRVLKVFMLDSAVEFYRATGKMPTRFSTELDIWETVWLANLEAIERYRPQPYSGKLTLLRAIDDGDFMWHAHALDYGWGRYALGGVEQQDMPGTHIGIFKEPAVKQLAEQLAQLLEIPPIKTSPVEISSGETTPRNNKPGKEIADHPTSGPASTKQTKTEPTKTEQTKTEQVKIEDNASEVFSVTNQTPTKEE